MEQQKLLLKKAVGGILILLLIFLSVFFVNERAQIRELENLTEFRLEGIGFFPFDEDIKLSPCNEMPCKETPQVITTSSEIRSIPVFLLYYEKTDKIILQIKAVLPSGFSAITCCYDFADPGQKKKYLRFVRQYKAELINTRQNKFAKEFVYRHISDLKKMGNGDVHQGFLQSGILEWLRAGKNPEAEWRKKYPAESL